MDAKEILFKHLDKHEISYGDHYIDHDDSAFDAIVEAMEEYRFLNNNQIETKEGKTCNDNNTQAF